MWYVDFAWKMPLKGKKIFRGCAPDPLTPGQVRGVPEGCCRGYVWLAPRESPRVPPVPHWSWLAGCSKKTAVEKLEVLKYGPKGVFEPPKGGFERGHFGAHCGPVRSFHRHHDLFTINL